MADPTPIRPAPKPRRAPAPKGPPQVRITEGMRAQARVRGPRTQVRVVPEHAFTPYIPPPGVLPSGHKPMAMDDAFGNIASWGTTGWANAVFSEGLAFLGYPYLAELAQRPEYRTASAVIAEDMTREWIKIKSTGSEDKSDKVKDLEAELTRLHVQAVFKEAAEQDGFFGRAHVYIDTGDTDDRVELPLDLGDGKSALSQAKVRPGKLKAIRSIEAMWCYPQTYESNDPLKGDWYNPVTWYVMAKQVHRSRLLTLVARPVPDILKPAYAFGGLSLSQILKPYVDNWLRTRQAVSDLVSSFVVNVLKTNLGVLSQAGGSQVFDRVDFFNAMRDNHGALVIDKDTEEWTNIQTSLASLDVLQAQSQEHMAAIIRAPLVKLLGIQPAGLNANSEGVIDTYDDTIHGLQEKVLRDPLTTVINFAQLNLWGEVDPEITFDFNPLRQMDPQERAQIEQTKAATDDVYVAMGAIDPADVRKRLASDEDSPYHGLSLTPPQPQGEVDELGQPVRDPDTQIANIVTRALRAANDAELAKLSKPDVGYEHPAQGPHYCSQCQHYEAADHSCQLVTGSIEPEDWCKLFEAKDETW